MRTSALPLLLAAAFLALLALSSAACALQNESEPNDEALNASALPLGEVLTGTLAVADFDWFMLATPEPGELTVTFTGASAYAEFDDAQFEALWTSSWPVGPDPFAFHFDLRNASSTYLRLMGAAWGNYTLLAAFSPGFTSKQGPSEVEPNDGASNATAAALNTSLEGRLAVAVGDIDVWRASLPAAGAFTIEISGCCNSGDMSWELSPLWLEIRDAATGEVLVPGFAPRCFTCPSLLGFFLHGPREFLLWFYEYPYLTDDFPITYTLRLLYSPDFSATAGASEAEPNNNATSATPIALGQNVSGTLNGLYNDEDVWVYRSSATQWAAVTVGGNLSAADVVVAEESGEPIDGFNSGSVRVFYADETKPSYIHLRGCSCNYTIAIALVPDTSVYFAGPGEVEPNQGSGRAQFLQGNGTTTGILDFQFDPYDGYSLEVHAGDFVVLNITDDGFIGQPNFAVSTVPSDVFLGADLGGLWAGARGPFFAAKSGRVLISASDEYYGGTYTIERQISSSPWMSDGELSLDELRGEPRFAFTLAASKETEAPPAFFNLWQGVLYGTPVCARHGIANALGPVPLRPGQILDSVPEGGRRFVLVWQGAFQFETGLEACLPALALNASALAAPPLPLRPGAFLSGDGAALVGTLALESESSAAGQLALWAVLSPPTASDIALWKVDDSDAVRANQLLQQAGLSQRVPLPPSPTPPTPPANAPPPRNPTGGGFTPSGFAGTVLLGGLLGGLVGVVVAFVQLFRRQFSSSGPAGPGKAGATASCARCSAALPPGWTHCPSCGAPR